MKLPKIKWCCKRMSQEVAHIDIRGGTNQPYCVKLMDEKYSYGNSIGEKPASQANCPWCGEIVEVEE